MSRRTIGMAVFAGLSAIAMAPTDAYALGGKSDNGDAYLNDAQKNPRFIEPYADRDPSRYRASNPQAGYGDRERSAYGSYARDDGYYGPRGRVEVRPYNFYRP